MGKGRRKRGSFRRRTGFVGGNAHTENLAALRQAAVLFMVRLGRAWRIQALPDVLQLVQLFDHCVRLGQAGYKAKPQEEHETKEFSHGDDHSNGVRRLAKKGVISW